jgi:hypothetical protein
MATHPSLQDLTTPLLKRWRTLLLGELLLLSIVVTAIVWRPEGTPTSYQFNSETSLITYSSFTLLALAMAGGLRNAMRSFESSGYRWLWGLFALAAAYLAADEVMGFHEELGEAEPSVYTTGQRIFGVFRSWNDLLVILYGVGAIIGWLCFRKVLARRPFTYALLIVAFACYAIHTLIDSGVEPPTSPSTILEETAKLHCSFYLALAAWWQVPVHPRDA